MRSRKMAYAMRSSKDGFKIGALAVVHRLHFDAEGPSGEFFGTVERSLLSGWGLWKLGFRGHEVLCPGAAVETLNGAPG
ncbi:hypothetical protein PHSY_006900 [Pseudozyma hubeiensis SY62]|uniref:Uncharacterized protein n=1 Tax=Pseudozyma hubeiensis (strain SY62) TaxID=1305764 RepID=R9PD69_PSEHS|nr:hypothetical protein PHSY_006900 [Pseudozyma hubeiensis SY62]GAC99299.1 hypothetical protein PHSY_006900 [Pseudozyma hubeiensis SY62]